MILSAEACFREDSSSTSGSQSSISVNSNDCLAKADPYAAKPGRTCNFLDKNCILFCIIFFFSILLSTVSIVLASISLAKAESVKEQFQSIIEDKPHMRDLCVPCSTLKQGPYTEENDEISVLAQQTKNGVNICCAEDAEKSSRLLDLFFRRKIKEYLAKGVIAISTGINSTIPHNGSISTTGAVSAHLVMGFPDSNSVTGMSSVRHWSLDDPTAHMNGIHFGSMGRLVVETSGLYFLYSQVRYDMYHLRADSSHNSIHHSVLRYSLKYPNDGTQVLLKSSITLCWAEEKDYEDQVTYVGAAVFLNAFDELFVEVSNFSQVSRDPKASYFGLFKAG